MGGEELHYLELDLIKVFLIFISNKRFSIRCACATEAFIGAGLFPHLGVRESVLPEKDNSALNSDLLFLAK